MKPITLREREVQRLKATGEALVVREVKPQPEQREGGITPILFDVSGWEFMDIEGGGQPVKCPLGKPGDRLWVRETWAVNKYYDGRPGNGCGPIPEVAVECRTLPDAVTVLPGKAHRSIGEERGRWRSAVTMPRWASRFTVETVEVQVQRVQDISEDEAEETGVEEWMGKPQVECDGQVYHYADRSFVRTIRNELGLKWNTNPWCWFALVKEVK